MNRVKMLLINFISTIFGNVLIYKNGGIWKMKDKLNYIKTGFVKDLLINIYERKLNKTGSWIGYNSHFENSPIFPHGVLSIFISGDTYIGKNCVIFQQTTIGSNSLADSHRKGSPHIGDNCYIGAGAKIIGNVKIGNNCRIGANCVVVKDMKDNSVAVLQPTRIIEKENLNNKYYTKGIDGWYYYKDGCKIKDSN